MLVLSRHKNEAVYVIIPKGYKGLTEDIKIDVMTVEIRGDKVRLGFAAPKEVVVHRQEIFEAIQRADKKAEIEKTNFLNTPSEKNKEKYYGSNP